MTTERMTMTVEEAGEVLGIGRGLAYRGVNDGSIPSVKIGKRFLVPKSALERMLLETPWAHEPRNGAPQDDNESEYGAGGLTPHLGR